jgi:hypothetical protein
MMNAPFMTFDNMSLFSIFMVPAPRHRNDACS